jgi:hypothetical protein
VANVAASCAWQRANTVRPAARTRQAGPVTPMMEEKMDARIGTRLWDRGKVYKDDERIAEVVYALQVVQETIDGVERQDITGQVRVVEGKRNLINEGALVLQFSGGRKWEFLASIDMGSGVYNVMGASGAGLAPN